MEETATALHNAETKLRHAIWLEKLLANRAMEWARARCKPLKPFITELAKRGIATKQPFKSGGGLFVHDSGS